MTTDEFALKYKNKFGGDLDFSKSVYTRYDKKIVVTCPKHGDFEMTPHDLMRGKGCPYCGRERGHESKKLGLDKFIERANKIHNNKYDYSKVSFNKLSDKVDIICPVHGVFKQAANKHLLGRGCPVCANEKRSKRFSKGYESFVNESREKFGDKFSYDKAVYVNKNTPLIITCPIHGDVEVAPSTHLKSNTGCKYCSMEELKMKTRETKEHFVEKAREVHDDLYDYSNFKYVNWHTPGYVTCRKHGDFLVTPCNHTTNRSGCPKCGHFKSRWENEIYEFIVSLNVDAEQSNRSVLGGSEIDVYVPSFNLGIECDGLYWHDEKHVDKKYHLRKTLECKKKGIRLIHIFEDEWKYKSEIWKSMIANILGITSRKYYARKCEIREVPSKEKIEFLNNNHIQGDAASQINVGLYYNDELVSLMTFGKPRINLGGVKNGGNYELVRFCNKLDSTVIGGASKLFKWFVDVYNPSEVVSYSDRRWSVGKLYETLNFEHDHDSRPNYFYVSGMKRMNRFMFRKSKLIKEGYEPNKSEHEIMLERGIPRIYDCGTMVWKWIK